MRARVKDILTLLKFTKVSDDDKVVSAEKLFVASRVLNFAYDQIEKGAMQVGDLTQYIQALIEYRDDQLEFRFEFDEQTGEDKVYFTRQEQSIYSKYASQFRQSDLMKDLLPEEGRNTCANEEDEEEE